MKAVAEHVQRAREAHWLALAELARSLGGPELDGLKLWRKLRRIEQQAGQVAVEYCNGRQTTEGWERFVEQFTNRVALVLGGVPPGFFVNGDPRGWTLKLQPGSVPFNLHEDWGRYQILAPTID